MPVQRATKVGMVKNFTQSSSLNTPMKEIAPIFTANTYKLVHHLTLLLSSIQLLTADLAFLSQNFTPVLIMKIYGLWGNSNHSKKTGK